MKTPVEILKEAKALLTPETWTKEVQARNAGGFEVDPLGDEACSWCLEGALCRITRSYTYGSRAANRAWGALVEAAEEQGYDAPFVVNDTADDVSKVHAIIDQAIERLQ